jgi:hypothetical protein
VLLLPLLNPPPSSPESSPESLPLASSPGLPPHAPVGGEKQVLVPVSQQQVAAPLQPPLQSESAEHEPVVPVVSPLLLPLLDEASSDDDDEPDEPLPEELPDDWNELPLLEPEPPQATVSAKAPTMVAIRIELSSMAPVLTCRREGGLSKLGIDVAPFGHEVAHNSA